MKLLFWTSALLVLYTYAGYPALLWLLARIKRQAAPGSRQRPLSVSIVLAFRNEQARVAARLENLLSQELAGAELEIIVVDDGSSDATGQLAGSFACRGVRVIRLERPGGKALAVNKGVALAGGEIVVFADARQRFAADAVSRLLDNFRDPEIGCVSGQLVLLADRSSQIREEMGAYWRYEKSVRRLESLTGSVVGATGAIYAIRRELFRPLPPQALLDDVLIPLAVIGKGYRCSFDNSALAYDLPSKNAVAEWKRKVRTLSGNWQMLSLRPELLLPWRNPCWWRLISHKLLRLAVPAMLAATLASGALLPGLLYRAATVLQSLGYGTALAGLVFPELRRFRPVKLGYFLLVMNAATVAACWRWLTGGCATAWQPATGGEAIGWKLAGAGERKRW